MSRDYIVVYEEEIEGPAYDEVNIEVENTRRAPKHFDADFNIKVTNKSGAMATTGLILTLLGGLISLFTAVFYMMNYPDAWWDEAEETIPRVTAILAVVGTLLLIVGNLLVGFGRQLHAFGALKAIRFRRD